MKNYVDLQNREFPSLKALCRENDIAYERCYYLINSKGYSIKEAIKDGLDRKEAGLGAFSSYITRKKPFVRQPEEFTPISKCPGLEYIRYCKWSIEKGKEDLERKKGMDAVKLHESIKNTEKVLSGLDRYWIDAMDAMVCGDETSITLISERTRETIKIMLYAPTGIYKDIYETFSKKYRLGKYSMENAKGN